jgi:16S rRNA (guanine527-N7)-methyltransferase
VNRPARHNVNTGNLQAFDEALLAGAKRWDLVITPGQLARLRAHYQAMVNANRTMNLTRITEPVASAVKHYLDSMALFLWTAGAGVQAETVLDVGTGAGLPAWPLAVMRPEWSVTAIDATGKKIAFLQGLIEAVGLANLSAEQGHSEHWGSRREFDLVVLRAVALLGKGVRQAGRHVKRGGRLVAYKTDSITEEEREEANQTGRKLGLTKHEPFRYDLQLGQERMRRALYIYER